MDDWRERTVLAYLDEPPFCAPSPHGHPAGCDIEVAEHVLAEAGVRQVVFELATFPELIPGLIDGRWHVSTPMFITPERAGLIRYSRPVWAALDGFIVRAGDEQTYTSYEAIASHRGARLAVVVGQVQRETAIRAGVLVEQIIEFGHQDAAAFAVRAGEADASASTAPGNRAFVERAAEPDPRRDPGCARSPARRSTSRRLCLPPRRRRSRRGVRSGPGRLPRHARAPRGDAPPWLRPQRARAGALTGLPMVAADC